ncbi:hypothetical protein GCM10011529_28170 [Polymorphobacter glacialis]|uniref:Uncharacterized protein n=1 Tax=Sandarakinorhabdus glacialis TaxID=1614636 RepID=A0A917EAR9_9SPHN|nr:hypothetical protein [Polymorphobacter glacialis]GGE19912.1 hypothetical protein GCM10011529_28170 [Polymorphobacter glacialis]
MLGHDQVNYVVSGGRTVMSDGVSAKRAPGMAAHLYTGANVGIVQAGAEPLVLIVVYPVAKK